jgi:hypothetical protein
MDLDPSGYLPLRVKFLPAGRQVSSIIMVGWVLRSFRASALQDQFFLL